MAAMSDLIPAYVIWLRACSRSANTINKRERLLRLADRSLPDGLHQADPDQLVAFLAHPSWQRWTRNTYHRHLRGFYRWRAESRGLPDPMARIPRPPEGPKTPRPAGTDIVRMLLVQPWPWPLIGALASYGGLRVSEIADLDRDDVDPDRIRVLGKGAKVRYVETHPVIWDMVSGRPPGRLVRSGEGLAITGQAISLAAHRLFKRLGVRCKMHWLRHWFATTALETGADLETVRQLLGHEKLDTTRNYLLVTSGRRREAILRLPDHRTGSDRPVVDTGRAA